MPLKIIPAIDIMNHQVVQLVGGVPGTEKIKMPDPLSAAQSWVDKGAKYLHVVDLDAAKDGGQKNFSIIEKLAQENAMTILWALVPIALLSIPGCRHLRYLTPVLPAFALLAALGYADADGSVPGRIPGFYTFQLPDLLLRFLSQTVFHNDRYVLQSEY